ncbi:hypothetical protein [Paracoccus rhizosphaerae]|uniref:Uncharacterized protein n=1 Tax=Paracoccus rhizosphaerae TaxID=1133347 RepID=A0ABV6CEK6_9RHOB|nr:hypothetical protein [Paracoccus rhizosphaerae]
MVGKSVDGQCGVDDALLRMQADVGNIPLSPEVRALAMRLAQALDTADGPQMTMPNVPDHNQGLGQDEHP